MMLARLPSVARFYAASDVGGTSEVDSRLDSQSLASSRLAPILGDWLTSLESNWATAVTTVIPTEAAATPFPRLGQKARECE